MISYAATSRSDDVDESTVESAVDDSVAEAGGLETVLLYRKRVRERLWNWKSWNAVAVEELGLFAVVTDRMRHLERDGKGRVARRFPEASLESKMRDNFIAVSNKIQEQ